MSATDVRLYDAPTGAMLAQIAVGTSAHLTSLGSRFIVAELYATVDTQIEAGLVALYDGTTGALIRTIPNPVPQRETYFGEWVIPTANGNFVVATYTKPAYLFDATGAKLADFTLIGEPFPLAGDRFLVTQPYVDPGAIELREGTTANVVRAIPNPEPGKQDLFGDAVDLDGTFVTTTWADDPGGLVDATRRSRSRRERPSLIRAIHDPAARAGDEFGAAIARAGEMFLVAAPKSDTADVMDAGIVYAFDRTTGQLVATFPNPEPDTEDFFGHISVAALANGNFVIGAVNDDHGAPAAGTVYLYRK